MKATLQLLQDSSYKQSKELEATKRKINGMKLSFWANIDMPVFLAFQRVFRNIVNDLKENFSRLDEQKIIFEEKDKEINQSYLDLLKYKRNFIDLLAKIQLPEEP